MYLHHGRKGVNDCPLATAFMNRFARFTVQFDMTAQFPNISSTSSQGVRSIRTPNLEMAAGRAPYLCRNTFTSSTRVELAALPTAGFLAANGWLGLFLKNMRPAIIVQAMAVEKGDGAPAVARGNGVARVQTMTAGDDTSDGGRKRSPKISFPNARSHRRHS